MIKFVFRWAFRLLILAIVLIVAFILVKDSLMKSLVERRLRVETGLPVKIARFESDLLSPRLTLEGLKLYNSAEFGGTVFIDLPEIHLDYDATAFAAGKLRLKLARIDLAEVNIVEGPNGVTNLQALENRLKTRRAQFEIEFAGIDTLNLTVGKLRYTSLRQPHRNREFNIGLTNEVVNHVTSTADLSGVVLKVFMHQYLAARTPPEAASPWLLSRAGIAGRILQLLVETFARPTGTEVK
jgi:uncharacterized protein involved in outer membrane biogenesis